MAPARIGARAGALLAAWMIGSAALAASSTMLKSDFELGAQWRVNSTARLLAGLTPWYPGQYTLAETPAWKEHSAAMQTSWTELRARAAAIKSWREEQLPAGCGGNNTLLYPFSGPDFFNAFWLFPQCSTYVMFGLELIGEVPEVESLNERDFARLLSDVRTATSDLFNRNYFITENMSRQLHTPQLRGVVPLLVISMALSGAEILRMAPVDLGRSHAQPTANDTPVKMISLRKPRGIAIDWRSPGSAGVKRLIYFSVDATDSSLARYPEFVAFLHRYEPSTTLLKSASYLLHSHEFSRLRSTLLKVSRALVQDDSGLPYRTLVSRGWQMSLHGNYTVPIPPFEGAFQPALQAAYQAQHPESLPFAFGYSFQDQRDDRANLMVGRRLSPPRSLASLGHPVRGARLRLSSLPPR